MATTEYAVQLPDGKVQPMPSREYAERWAAMTTLSGEPVRPEAVVVEREVTDWVAVH